MRRLLLVVLVALPVAGVPPVAHAQDELEPPKITILRQGRGERSTLRYALAAGQTQRVVFSTNTSIGQRIGDRVARGSSPQLELETTATIAEVTPEGLVNASLTIDDVRVDEDAVGAEQAIEAVQPLVGFTQTLTMTDRGEVTVATATIPETLDSSIRQLLEQFVTQARTVTVPLPEEPLGRGARWRASTRITVGGITFRQSMLYELTRRDGDEVELSVRVTQTAPRQSFTDPVSGTRIRLLSSKGTGDGELRLDLGSPLPIEGEMHTQVRQQLRAEGQRLSQTVTVNAFIDPA